MTPNPDILCNNLVKFDCFLEEALEYGFDKIATGHYARIIESGGKCPPDKGGAQRAGFFFDYIPYNQELTELAQQNRKNPNPYEKKFWYDILKTPELSKYKFTKQKPLLNYIADFYCSELQLIIEIDGDSHSENIEYDKKRSEELYQYGIRILRYTNSEVK
ncbi:DUF559 domain-containing protein [bacterium]|nr:DUF559 domain-containing protein [bacterium]